MGQILAAIDIGSNTVHLLVAEAESGLVSKIDDLNDWISLGEIVGKGETIPVSIQDRLMRTLDTFKRQAALEGAQSVYVFATEAVRRAKNADAILRSIRQATGLKVELISALREAELGLRGALLDSDGPAPFLMAEVGGGSAQVALCSGKKIIRESSHRIGTGALIAQLGLECPSSPKAFDQLIHVVMDALDESPVFENVKHVIASGGVARGLWRALHPDGERVVAYEELDYLIWATQRLTLEQIIGRFSVKPKRAATLLPGAVVYKLILQRVEKSEMTVSRFGVREGAILEIAEGNIKPCRL